MKALELKSFLQTGGKACPFWILGPCVLEERGTVLKIAEEIASLREHLKIPVVFKASFDKANRSSAHAKRGPGLEEGLTFLSEIKREFSLPLLTDVHEAGQVKPVAEVVDIVQIPAFLSRQTDLIAAAASSGAAVNVKKGQFMAPQNVAQIIEKLNHFGSVAHWVTERGVSFGYQRLIVDFAGFHLMHQAGADLIFDCTHSVQLPGSTGTATGGVREAIPDLARAAAAVGVSGFFAEVHPNPEEAWSDATNAWPLAKLENLVRSVKDISEVAHG